MRKLPVYMIIDCSSSMNGDAIEAVDQGFRNLISKLMNDPYTCELVWISIITFNSDPYQLIPLSPLEHYYNIPLQLKGCSNLGKAIEFLTECMESEVRKQSMDQKGDWKPLVFLLSDGRPTDDWEEAIRDISASINLIACGVGINVNIDNLKKATSLVVLLKDMTQETFDQFIDFLSSTMTTASRRSDGQSDKITAETSYGRYTKIVLT